MSFTLRVANRDNAANYPELWSDVPSYDGKYAANRCGFILNRLSGKVIANTTYRNGYVYVSITTDAGSKNVRLHRIIAIALLPNPENKPQVNHRSGVKSNNHVANLEWATSSENLRHAYVTELNPGSKPQLGKFNGVRARPVKQYTLSDDLLREWPSAAEAGRAGFTAANITQACNGGRPTCQGFIWKH